MLNILQALLGKNEIMGLLLKQLCQQQLNLPHKDHREITKQTVDPLQELFKQQLEAKPDTGKSTTKYKKKQAEVWDLESEKQLFANEIRKKVHQEDNDTKRQEREEKQKKRIEFLFPPDEPESFDCKFCPEGFDSKKELKSHIKRMHKQ